MTISSIAIQNAPVDVQIEYCMEQHRLPPEERSADYFLILQMLNVDDLPKELRPVEIRKIPDSGQLSLDVIGQEGGIPKGDEVAINYAQCRDLIGKAGKTEMAFSEWYGASNVPPINYSGTYYATGPIGTRNIPHQYGSQYAREIRTVVTASAGMPSVNYIGAIRVGSGQARAYCYTLTKSATGAANTFNTYSHFKWKVTGRGEGEGNNGSWSSSSYEDSAGTKRYFADSLSTPGSTSLWSALSADGTVTIQFWFGMT
jgi:hypothetical protein